MKDIINFFNIIYQIITFRYRVIKNLSDEIEDNKIYKNIIQEELEFYTFYKLTGIYMRNTKERKKYLEFYDKNKSILNMQFKEFVSAHNYVDIDLQKNIIQVNNSHVHWIGYSIFILTIFTYCLLLFQVSHLSFTFLLISIIAILFLFISVSFIEPYEKAKAIKKTFQ